MENRNLPGKWMFEKQANEIIIVELIISRYFFQFDFCLG